MPSAPPRVALVGPREDPFTDDPDREHRERMLRSFEEICGVLAFTRVTNAASRRVLERQRFELTEEVIREGELMCAYLRTWSGD